MVIVKISLEGMAAEIFTFTLGFLKEQLRDELIDEDLIEQIILAGVISGGK
jgi:hypothetical protein